MSFDLVVWYEPSPITGAQARHKLDKAYDHGDESGFIPHDAVRRFRQDLLAQFPAGEDLDPTNDTAVWSVTPDDSDRYISMSMSFSKADDVVPVILQLADTHGLVCLDPQNNSIHLPPALGRNLTLTVPGRRELTNPESEVLQSLVRQALQRGSYAILEDQPGYYLQAGSGPGVGMRQPGYAIEYRDGSADAHFRHETLNLEEVLAAFESFRAGDGAFRTTLAWQPYP